MRQGLARDFSFGQAKCPESEGSGRSSNNKMDAETSGLFDFRNQSAAKQYNNPLPPVRTRFFWLQPRDGCVEFQDKLSPPCRLTSWPC